MPSDETLYWGWASLDDAGASEAGRRAAEDALRQLDPRRHLGHDGARPVVVGHPTATISISHGRQLAVAVVSTSCAVGVDLCEHARGPQIREMASRFLTTDECTLVTDDRSAAAVWAAKEAGLKAMGFGLYEARLFDAPETCPVRVASVAPPRYATPGLVLHLEDRGDVMVALALAD